MTKPNPLTFVEEQHLFYFNYGLCLTQFTNVEETLIGLLSIESTKRGAKAMRDACYGIESFRAKLEFVDRFIATSLRDRGGEVVAAWDKTRELCRRASSKRNELAHWHLSQFPNAAPGLRFVLVAPAANPSHPRAAEARESRMKGTPPPTAIGVRQLVEIRFQFFDAFVALARLYATVTSSTDPFADTDLSAGPPKLVDITRQFRTGVQKLLDAQSEGEAAKV